MDSEHTKIMNLFERMATIDPTEPLGEDEASEMARDAEEGAMELRQMWDELLNRGLSPEHDLMLDTGGYDLVIEIDEKDIQELEDEAMEVMTSAELEKCYEDLLLMEYEDFLSMDLTIEDSQLPDMDTLIDLMESDSGYSSNSSDGTSGSESSDGNTSESSDGNTSESSDSYDSYDSSDSSDINVLRDITNLHHEYL